MQKIIKIQNFRIINNIKKFFHHLITNQDGGSLVESGLLIGFAVLILFLLITTVESIYNWASSNISSLFSGIT